MVTVISDSETFFELRPAWQQLHAASGADLFLTWDWLASWWVHLGGNRELFIMLAHDQDGHLRGLWPLSLEMAWVGFRRIRRLRFLGDDQVGSDYLDVVSEPSWKNSINKAFAATLLDRAKDWDLLDLRDMDQHSGTPGQLLSTLGDAFEMRSVEGLQCPGQAFTPGLSAEDFLRRTRRFKNYTRRRNWLQNQPGFTIEICRGGCDGLETAMDNFFRLHRLRWLAKGGSAGIAGKRVEAFHRDAMRRLMVSGQLRLYTLWVAGASVASVYALTGAHTFYYYQAGMDPAWRSRSVGLVLIGETFLDAIRSGYSRYDFLRGEEAYKSDWVGDSRRLVSRRLFAQRGRGARAVQADIQLGRGRGLLKSWLQGAASTVLDNAR